MIRDIKYIVMSDIHLGISNESTDRIGHDLMYMLSKYEKTFKDYDMFIIAGDVTEKLLRNGSVENNQVIKIMMFIVRYCVKNNIILRILEGTPSHDWNQMSVLDAHITEIKNLELDFKYIANIEIEYISSLDINILYIPDQYGLGTDDNQNEVMSLLKSRGLELVDLSIMHGHFDYQLPEHIGGGHSVEYYTKITKYYVHIGHVHTFSTYKNIIANGSFSRLRHGEEEAKGFIVCDIWVSGRKSFTFIENKNAPVYDTCIVVPEDTIQSLVKRLKKYGNEKVNVKLKAPDCVLPLEELSLRFKNIKIIVDRIVKKGNKDQILMKQPEHIDPIDCNNIDRLLLNEMIDKKLVFTPSVFDNEMKEIK